MNASNDCDQNSDLTVSTMDGQIYNKEYNTEEIHKLNREIRQINEQLILNSVSQLNAYESLTRELERNRAIAEAMQYSILWPQPAKRFSGLTVASFYEPAAGDALVGGDFFDAFKLYNNSIMLVVGDVTGKGLKAAARTVEVIFALRAFAQDYKNPSEIIGRLNRFICEFHNDDDGSLENALIVISLVVVDPATGIVHAASGGAEPPLILRASGIGEEIPTRGLILGIDCSSSYDTVQVSLDIGDTLFITTDGITEARQGYEFFGSENLINTTRRTLLESGTLQDIGDNILNDAKIFAGGHLSDDACLLVVQRNDP